MTSETNLSIFIPYMGKDLINLIGFLWTNIFNKSINIFTDPLQQSDENNTAQKTEEDELVLSADNCKIKDEGMIETGQGPDKAAESENDDKNTLNR